MPQPLNRVVPKPEIILYPDILIERPEFGARVARAIATWSEVEAQLADLLAFLLGANAAPAMAMYQALTSSQAQTAALNGAASAILEPADKEIFDAIMMLVKSSIKERNKLAHWTWGRCLQIRNGAVLADPSARLDHKVKILSGKLPIEDPRIPFDRIFVYTVDDLEEITARMSALRTYAHLFRALNVFPERERERLRRQLSSEPDIAGALSRLRVNPQKNLPVPKPRSRKEHPQK